MLDRELRVVTRYVVVFMMRAPRERDGEFA